MTCTRRKQIYYIPGIISLAVLPFLFSFYAHKRVKANSINVIKVYIPNTDTINRSSNIITWQLPPKRNYTDIIIKGEPKADNTKLDFSRVRIGEILAENDTINGLHFHFSDRARYGTFVKTIDILLSEGAKRYYTDVNDVWFFHVPPDTTNHNWICGYSCDVMYVKPVIPWWTATKDEAIKIWESSWAIITAFISLVVLPLVIVKLSPSRYQ